MYQTQNYNILVTKQDIFDICKKTVDAGYNGSNVIIPHVCNNLGLFGAGFASAVNKNYPEVKDNYQLLSKSFLSKNLGYTQFIDVYSSKDQYKRVLTVANMIAQNGVISSNNKRPLDYESLVKSMVSVRSFILNKNESLDNSTYEIHAPKFGSGLAGGNWKFILELIYDIWISYKIRVVIHEQ
jgi:hypothetical protein